MKGLGEMDRRRRQSKQRRFGEKAWWDPQKHNEHIRFRKRFRSLSRAAQGAQRSLRTLIDAFAALGAAMDTMHTRGTR